MKIAIDVSPVVYGTGVSVYIKNLVPELLALDRRNEYILFGGSLRRMAEIGDFVAGVKGEKVTSRVVPIAPTVANLLWNQFHVLPIEVFTGKQDVFHSSDWSQPPSKAFKVSTIHDLVPLMYPGSSHPRIISAHRARISWVRREVDRIIVPSKQTARDCELLGISQAKIRVIPEGISENFKRAQKREILKFKKTYGLEKGYVLMVGTSRRKNIDGGVLGFEKFKTGEMKLVIVGEKPKDFPKSGDVIFTGFVSDDLLPTIYSGAEALLYPSFYEGFGLPVLEAFACQTPVVASNLASLREVGGNACIYVDPFKPESIARGLELISQRKKRLISLGKKRLARFSWAENAAKTLSVYEEAGQK